MRVLITGGTGFLGRHAAVRLKRQGHQVRILGRNDAIGKQLETFGISYLKSDLADRERVIEACKGQEQVIHSGGLASPWGKYDLFYRANVVGTKNIVEGCLKHGVQRLVNLSTPSLYFDYQDRLQIKESDPLPKPTTAYAKTKGLADEQVDAAFAKGLPSISIRPRAIFGPGDQAVLVRLIRVAKKGTVPLVGGGKSYVDLSYIDNVVDALLLCMTAPSSCLGKKYNITNGEPITVRQLFDLLSRNLGLSPKFRPMPFSLAYGIAAAMELSYKLLQRKDEPPLTRYGVGLMAKSQTLDITAAQTELGYQPQITLADGMARFAHWWSQREKDSSPYAKLGISDE